MKWNAMKCIALKSHSMIQTSVNKIFYDIMLEFDSNLVRFGNEICLIGQGGLVQKALYGRKTMYFWGLGWRTLHLPLRPVFL